MNLWQKRGNFISKEWFHIRYFQSLSTFGLTLFIINARVIWLEFYKIKKANIAILAWTNIVMTTSICTLRWFESPYSMNSRRFFLGVYVQVLPATFS